MNGIIQAVIRLLGIEQLRKTVEGILSTLSEIKDTVASIVADLVEIKSDIADLISKLPAEGGLSATEVADLKVALEDLKAKSADAADDHTPAV